MGDENMEVSKDQVKDFLFKETHRFYNTLNDVIHSDIHLWKYATASLKRARPFFDVDRRIGFASDGFVKGRIESAFLSADKMADESIKHHGDFK